MIFVLPGILLIGFVLLILWALFFRSTVRQAQSEEQSLADARQREADFQRWLSTPNEPLYCASCDAAFRGPLSQQGCPRCNTRTLVIPVRASNDPCIVEAARRLPPLPIVAHEDEEAAEAVRNAPVVMHESAPQTRETLPQGNTGK